MKTRPIKLATTPATKEVVHQLRNNLRHVRSADGRVGNSHRVTCGQRERHN